MMLVFVWALVKVSRDGNAVDNRERFHAELHMFPPCHAKNLLKTLLLRNATAMLDNKRFNDAMFFGRQNATN